MPKIILESLTEPGRTWELNQFPYRIGRGRDNNLVITSTKLPDNRPAKTYISGHHAEIRQVGQGYSVTDLKSTNGTYVNELRVKEEAPLKPGDRLSLGSTYQFVLRIQDSETPSGPLTAPLTISQTVPIPPKIGE